MGKGAIKFGGKSGVLPEVRQIFKLPVKPIVRPANSEVGYAEGIKHPKGTSREQPIPEVRTVSELIKSTIKDPKSIPDLQKASATQKEKLSKAALRRKYYVDSLKKEESKLSYEEEKQAKRAEAAAKAKAETKYETSRATKLTLPTISKLLEGPFMRDRTEEEKQVLAAKREANRLQNELKGSENRAVDLLSLYYASENFITTEEELKHAVDQAFDHHFVTTDPEIVSRSRNSALKDALFGTINGKPGLAEIEEEMTGESKDYRERVAEAAASQIEEIKRREMKSSN